MNKVLKCPKCSFLFLSGKRSLSMNSYLHAILTSIADHIGEVDIGQVKEDTFRKIGFTERKADIYTGEERVYRKHSSDMDDQECSELCEKLRHLGREFFGIYIPDATEWKKMMRSYKTSENIIINK